MKIVELKNSTSKFGGKAVGLALLNKIGVPVPNGFVVSDTLNINFDDNQELDTLLLNLKKLDPQKKLAVRSSALAEDGTEKSFAGVFESVLNVDNDLTSVLKAINKVNESAKTDVVNSYTNGQQQLMNIVVQEMVEPDIAGVLFTEAIDLNGDDVVLFECVNGLADKLVSGAATPAQVIIGIKNGKININKLRIEGALLNLENLQNIFKYVDKIKKISEVPLDIEWCIDKKGNPFFVQARPITSPVFINKATENAGIVASRGYVEGTTYVIDENKSDEEIKEAIDNFPEGAILIAGVTETLYMPAIKKAKGIITEEGSALSHAAIVSRELGIPCIAGYKNAISLFPTGTDIILDASNAKIICNGIENKLDENKSFEFGELYCFDNSCKVKFDRTIVFFESTYGGLMLHMDSEDADARTMSEIEKFSRKQFKKSPEQHFDDKYLWYLEIERFKKLPYFNQMYQEMLDIVEEKNCEKLDNYYSSKLKMLNELVTYKQSVATEKEQLLIDEIGAATNLILDAMLPLGYALRSCYLESVDLLNKYNISLNDLLSNEEVEYDNKKLKIIRQFLKRVAINRNEVYEKICNIGATSPEYFETRDDKIKLILTNFKEPTIDVFYDNLEIQELENIEEVMKPFFQKKNNNYSKTKRLYN